MEVLDLLFGLINVAYRWRFYLCLAVGAALGGIGLWLGAGVLPLVLAALVGAVAGIVWEINRDSLTGF